MSVDDDGGVLEPIKNTRDREPYEFYERLREAGDITWDEGVDALVVGSYDFVRAVFRQDERVFRKSRREEVEHDPVMRALAASPRPLAATVGEEHTRFHHWFLQAFSRANVARWRPTHIRPVVHAMIDRFVERGRAELVEEFASAVPVRAVASVLGLPWDDDRLIEICNRFVQVRAEYIEAIKARDERVEVGRRATAVASEFIDRVRPFVELGASGDGDDMISVFWNDGHRIFSDWNIDDVLGVMVTSFVGGSHSTASAAANGIYLLLTSPDLQDALRAGGEPAIEAFVEEALRVYGFTHTSSYRYANEDTQIGGFNLEKGAAVMALFNAANRDPRRYECPAHVDLERDNLRSHLAFAVGPRACAGMSLARGQLAEMYGGVLERLQDLRLDPDAEPPVMRGFGGRSYKPLNTLFRAAPR